ncbi:MAG: hypothetical protein ACON4Z_15500 [Planctomycetota bacterium]
MRSSILHVTLFLAGLLGTAWSLHCLDARPVAGYGDRKIKFAESVAGEFDTVILGSSRAEFGLVPAAIDEGLAAAGVDSRTVNLALSGYRPFEFHAIADQLRARLPDGRYRLLMELHSHSQSGADKNYMSPRRIATHTPSLFPARMGQALSTPRATPPLLENVYAITSQTVVNALRIGAGPRILKDLASPFDPRTFRPEDLLAERGWRDVADIAPGFPHMVRARQTWLPEQKRRQALEGKRRNLMLDKDAGGLPVAFLVDRARALEAAGFEVVYVVMPTLTRAFHGRDQVAALAEQVCVIDLDRPTEFPELFALDNFYDGAHLSAEGALACSRLLAVELAKVRSSVEQASLLPSLR